MPKLPELPVLTWALLRRLQSPCAAAPGAASFIGVSARLMHRGRQALPVWPNVLSTGSRPAPPQRAAAASANGAAPAASAPPGAAAADRGGSGGASGAAGRGGRLARLNAAMRKRAAGPQVPPLRGPALALQERSGLPCAGRLYEVADATATACLHCGLHQQLRC
jgi:hypothetical protein